MDWHRIWEKIVVSRKAVIAEAWEEHGCCGERYEQVLTRFRRENDGFVVIISNNHLGTKRCKRLHVNIERALDLSLP